MIIVPIDARFIARSLSTDAVIQMSRILKGLPAGATLVACTYDPVLKEVILRFSEADPSPVEQILAIEVQSFYHPFPET